MYEAREFSDEKALYSFLKRKEDFPLEKLLNINNKECKVLDHTLNPQKNKKIIAFSLYGDKEIYFVGAETNIKEAERVFPGWTCRFYCTKDVPNLQKLINDDRCEVVVLESKIYPMYWRFFAIDDPLVDIVCIRDSDSVISEKEFLAVSDWEKSEKTLHTMHDADSPMAHTKIMMGGMWGIKCKNKFSISSLVNLYVKKFNYDWQYGQDQNFLEQFIFPLFENDCIDHSSHTKIKWKHSVPFPDGGKIKFGGFVGDRVNPVQSRQMDMTQFSKDSNKIFLFCHQAVEDYIACNGLIRLFSEQNEDVIIPVKRSNFDFVSCMFEDLKNVQTISISDDNNGFNIYLDKHKETHRFIGLGFWGKNPAEFDPSNAHESFYKQLGVDPQLRFNKFYIGPNQKEKINEENINKIKDFVKTKENVNL